MVFAMATTFFAIALTASPNLGQTSAQPPRGVALSPVAADLSGQRPSTSFSVFNFTSRPVHVTISPADFSFDDNGHLSIHAPDCPFSARPFIAEIYPESFLLPSQRARDVRVSFHIPSSKPAGYHVALIVAFRTPTRADAAAPAAAFAPQLVFIATISVGNPKPDAEITRFAVRDGRASLTVRNSGPTHFRLNGGSHLAGRPLPPLLVLPGSERTFSVPIHDGEADRPMDALIDTGSEILKARRIP